MFDIISPHLFEDNKCRFCKCHKEEVEDNIVSLECSASDFIELTLYEKYKALAEKAISIKSDLNLLNSKASSRERDLKILEDQIKIVGERLGYIK